jgi:putative spermidine/putrescine transport system permease protein
MSTESRWSLTARAAATALIAGLLAFLFLPLLVVAGASLSSGDRPYVSFPPTGLSLHWYLAVPPRYWQAVGVSLAVAAGTAIATTAIAVPTALGLVRASFRGKPVLALLLRAPLQIPYVVTGIAFLQTYYLIAAATGIQLRATYSGLILGHLFLATPYATGSIAAVLARFNPRLEEAAASLGASPWRVFRRVTLPIILPGVYGGALYAFIISFGEVPVALFLGGPGRTTFPVEMFASMQFDFSPALLAVSTAMLLISFAVLILIQRAVGFDTIARPGSTR